jgi:hypothetical protein
VDQTNGATRLAMRVTRMGPQSGADRDNARDNKCLLRCVQSIHRRKRIWL